MNRNKEEENCRLQDFEDVEHYLQSLKDREYCWINAFNLIIHLAEVNIISIGIWSQEEERADWRDLKRLWKVDMTKYLIFFETDKRDILFEDHVSRCGFEFYFRDQFHAKGVLIDWRVWEGKHIRIDSFEVDNEEIVGGRSYEIDF